MPAGIARSPYIPAIAKALNWSLGRVRAHCNKAGYEAPYMDERRILKILTDDGVDVSKYLKSTGKNSSYFNPAASPATNGTELILSHPPSAPSGVLAVASQMQATTGASLIDRLARLLPGGDFENNKQTVRAWLKEHDIDGRAKDERKCLRILQEHGVNTEHFEFRGAASMVPAVSALPDVNKMSVPELRAFAEAAVQEMVKMGRTINSLKRRHKNMVDFLQQAKAIFFDEAQHRHRKDWTKPEMRAFMALEEAIEPIEEET